MLQPHGDNECDAPLCENEKHELTEAVVEATILPSMQKQKCQVYLPKDKRQKRYALQQVLSVRQQKIYEQQCEIEELRRRVREVLSDNKFLRDQNYWQAKALEKLDGKHAEIPQLINGHLEEIRVFREQIRRMKEMLRLERQRRHDAEAANQKALGELKHLRKLAEEENLFEREELMQTIDKLRVEADERGKLLANLERYAENLEKNQRFESLRASGAQREMRDTCQRLLDRIHELEQTVQEKQKIIELGNIYSKRYMKQPITTEHAPTESMNGNTVEPDGETNKYKLRERIRAFDQRRQDLEKKRDRVRRKRLQRCGAEQLENGECCRAELEFTDTEKSQKDATSVSPNDENFETGTDESENVCRLGSNVQNTIVLPKILSKISPSSVDSKRTRLICEAKQVKFSPIVPNNGRTVDEEIILKELQTSERLARLFAEASLERTRAEGDFEKGQRNHSHNTNEATNLGSCTKVNNQSTEPSRRNVQVDVKSTESGHNPDTACPTAMREDMQLPPLINRVQTTGQPHGDGDTPQETTEHINQLVPVGSAQSAEFHSPSSTAPVLGSSPKVSRTISDLSTFDSFELVPLPEATKLICRPCGEHELDTFSTEEISGTSSPTTSDTTAAGGEEELLWHGTPPFQFRSPRSSNRHPVREYRGPNGLVNASNDLEGLDIEYITETVFGPVQINTTGSAAPTSLQHGTATFNGPPRTKPLYTMITNNNAEEQEE